MPAHTYQGTSTNVKAEDTGAGNYRRHGLDTKTIDG